MKRKKGILYVLLFCLLLNLNSQPVSAAPSESAGDGTELIQTDITSSESQVTLTVGVKENAGLTSGRITISYDETLLTLSSAKGSSIWEMEDINTDSNKDGKKAISYAWVTTKDQNGGGTMLTVTFTAQKAADGKEVSVQTELSELYQADTAVTVPEKTLTESVKVTLPKQEPKPDPKPDPDTKPEETPDGDSGAAGETPENTDPVIKEIRASQPGETVVVALKNEDAAVSKEVLRAAKEKGVNLEFRLDNGVVWKINGKDIQEAKDLNLAVLLDTKNIPVSVLDALRDDKAKYQRQFSLAYEGDFGAGVTIWIPLGDAAKGYFANLYYYNPSTKRLEFVDAAKVGDDGYAQLTFTHASDYVIMVSGSKGPVQASAPAGADKAKTGDNTEVAGYVLLFGAAALILAAMAGKKRKKA